MNNLREKVELALRLAQLTGMKMYRGEMTYQEAEEAIFEQVEEVYKTFAQAEPTKEEQVV